MALNPTYSQTFAGVSYGESVVMGENPKIAQTLLDTWDANWTTANPTVATYQNGCLLGQATLSGAMTLFDSDDYATVPFKGIFFDETANASTVGTTGVFSNYAIRDGMMTNWVYASLIGAKGSTTDIDWLITNNYATKRTINGVVCVSFGVIGFGSN